MNRTKSSQTSRRKRRRGVLTFEWIILVTVLVIGIIGGLGAVRNAILVELHDLADAIEMLNIDPHDDCDDEVLAGEQGCV